MSIYSRTAEKNQMYISVAEAHNRLSRWLKEVKDQPITITRRGKPVGVIISPEEYERLHRVAAYLQMLRLSQSINESESGVTAEELFQASRAELENHS
jgi:prevent-host-death family protein